MRHFIITIWYDTGKGELALTTPMSALTMAHACAKIEEYPHNDPTIGLIKRMEITEEKYYKKK